MKRNRLRLTVAGPLVIIAVLLVAFGIIGSVSMRLGNDNIRAVIRAVSSPLTSTSANLLFNPLYTLNITEINDILSRYVDNHAIIFAAVYDTAGKRVAVVSGSWAPDAALSAAFSQQAIAQNRDVEQEVDSYLIITTPIGIGGQVIGAVEYVFDQKAMTTSMDAIQSQIIFVTVATMLGTALLSFSLIRFATLPLEKLAAAAEKIGAGDLAQPVRVEGAAEIVSLALSLDGMRSALLESYKDLQTLMAGLESRVEERAAAAESARAEAESARQSVESQMWLAAGQAILAEKMRGEQNIPQLAGNIIAQISQYLGAQAGALYLLEGKTLKIAAGYAFAERPGFSGEFQIGEGLVGQAAADQSARLVTCPENARPISSGLVDVLPRQLLLAPFEENGQLVGMIELATLTEFTQAQMSFLARVSESIGVAFRTAQARQRLAELLTKTQQQAEELQAQEEELRAANEELQAQAETLKVVRQTRGKR